MKENIFVDIHEFLKLINWLKIYYIWFCQILNINNLILLLILHSFLQFSNRNKKAKKEAETDYQIFK